jgi:putative acetyltransferase
VGACRKATPQDLEQLEACRRAAISACPGYDAEQLNIWLASEPKWPQLISDALVVELHGRIVGFCVASSTELGYLYVHPDHQRQGIGQYLVEQVEQPGMRCDCNPFSGHILERRGWTAVAPNRKERDGVVFQNTWYELLDPTPTSR